MSNITEASKEDWEDFWNELEFSEEDFEDTSDSLPALVSFSTIFTSEELFIKFTIFLEKIKRTY